MGSCIDNEGSSHAQSYIRLARIEHQEIQHYGQEQQSPPTNLIKAQQTLIQDHPIQITSISGQKDQPNLSHKFLNILNSLLNDQYEQLDGHVEIVENIMLRQKLKAFINEYKKIKGNQRQIGDAKLPKIKVQEGNQMYYHLSKEKQQTNLARFQDKDKDISNIIEQYEEGMTRLRQRLYAKQRQLQLHHKQMDAKIQIIESIAEQFHKACQHYMATPLFKVIQQKYTQYKLRNESEASYDETIKIQPSIQGMQSMPMPEHLNSNSVQRVIQNRIQRNRSVKELSLK